MDRDEILLIKRAQRGDNLAFDELVRKHDRQVLKLALSLVNDTEDAKDVYQEVFLRAYRAIGRFKFKSEFYTWLYRIVVNYSLNFRERRGRRQYVPLEEQVEGEEESWKIVMPDGQRNPEERILDSEISTQIERAMDKLSPQQRTVFVLRHYHGHKLGEIAEIMDCSEGTVKSYLFRATQKMKKLLRSYWKT